jgi:hypothetical protein
VERQVDLWTKRPAVHSVVSALRRPVDSSAAALAAVPSGRRRGVACPGNDEGPRPPEGDEGLGRKPFGRERQRQRIDMIRPATMRPNPMAKFHTSSDAMKGMRSLAT